MLMSGYLTNESLTTPGFYKLEKFKFSKVDQFVSTLHSLKAIDLDYADFYLSFDDANIKYKHLVTNFIYENFKNTRIRIFPFRLERFTQWRDAADKIPKSATTILLMNNLDHVFLPGITRQFREFVNFLELREPNAIGGIMHWQESIHGLGTKKYEDYECSFPVFYNKTYYTSGTTLIKPVFFKSWWEHDFTYGAKITRPDNPFGPFVNFDWTTRYIPAVEFFRHLDGYGHVGISSPQASDLRPCCIITDGFIRHTDWKVGINSGNSADLPFQRPKNFKLNTKTIKTSDEVKDYLINANSWLYSINRTFNLCEPKGFWESVKLILILFKLIDNKHLKKSLLRNYGLSKLTLYRLQHFIVIKYFKLRIHYPKLPKTIRELKKLSFIQILKLIQK